VGNLDYRERAFEKIVHEDRALHLDSVDIRFPEGYWVFA
jgi:hypothetical protein